MQDAFLVKVGQASKLLSEVRTIEDVKQLIDLAAAAEYYAKRLQLSTECVNYAAEIKLKAERRLGEFLKDAPKQGPGQYKQIPSGNKTIPLDIPPTLAEIGISKMGSSRAQKLADIPTAEFQQHIEAKKSAGEEITTTGLLREVARVHIDEHREARRREMQAQPLPEGKYRCIVIDPPWPMEKIEREERPLQARELDYPTMSLEKIAALPVATLANDGCHVYLWTTHKHLWNAFRIFTDWGVFYQCLLTWVKPTGMTPYSWMYNTEHVLFGRVGSLPLERNGLKLSIEAPVTRHSEKPAAFYERVALASPEPRLDMFARQQREGFDSWGNEGGDLSDSNMETG